MRRLPFIAALVLAGSSVHAQPYRGDRYDARRFHGELRGGLLLAPAYSARSERQFINVGGRGGHFDRIVFEAVRGAPVIRKVVVEYVGSPSPQVVKLDTQLPEGQVEAI